MGLNARPVLRAARLGPGLFPFARRACLPRGRVHPRKFPATVPRGRLPGAAPRKFSFFTSAIAGPLNPGQGAHKGAVSDPSPQPQISGKAYAHPSPPMSKSGSASRAIAAGPDRP